MENIVIESAIETQSFLTSEKRLFNRRGSNEQHFYDITSTSLPQQPTNLNVNAPIFVPKSPTKSSNRPQPENQSPPRRRPKSKRRGSGSSLRSCQYCKRKGFDEIMVATHTLRNPQTSEIICPQLLANICQTHPDSQDAHDRFECHLLGFRPFNIEDFKQKL